MIGNKLSEQKRLKLSFLEKSKLLDDTRTTFVKLGFYPSKIISNNNIFISRQRDIGRYIKEVGFSNNNLTSPLEHSSI